jgi:hypothetical protein
MMVKLLFVLLVLGLAAQTLARVCQAFAAFRYAAVQTADFWLLLPLVPHPYKVCALVRCDI